MHAFDTAVAKHFRPIELHVFKPKHSWLGADAEQVAGFIKKHPHCSRRHIENWWHETTDSEFDSGQLSNILTKLVRHKRITNHGTKAQPRWFHKEI